MQTIMARSEVLQIMYTRILERQYHNNPTINICIYNNYDAQCNNSGH